MRYVVDVVGVVGVTLTRIMKLHLDGTQVSLRADVPTEIAKMPKKQTKPRKPPGPAPELLTIEGNWRDAMWKLISKKRPEGGWPKPEKRKES